MLKNKLAILIILPILYSCHCNNFDKARTISNKYTQNLTYNISNCLCGENLTLTYVNNDTLITLIVDTNFISPATEYKVGANGSYLIAIISVHKNKKNINYPCADIYNPLDSIIEQFNLNKGFFYYVKYNSGDTVFVDWRIDGYFTSNDTDIGQLKKVTSLSNIVSVGCPG